MIYQFFRPSTAAQAFVKHYHLLHFQFRGLNIPRTKVYYPRPEQCLTFDIHGQVTGTNRKTEAKYARPFSYISKQQVSTYDLSFTEEYCMLKVVFQPGALYRLFGIPLHELGDQYVDASLLPSAELGSVNEELANVNSYRKMIQVVDGYISRRVTGTIRSEHAIDKLNGLLSGKHFFLIS